MSEFTSGLLFLSQHNTKVNEWLSDKATPYIIQPLNEHWITLFIPGEFYEGIWLSLFSKISNIDLVLELSKIAPLLYFNNAEDHGWGYRIFVEGSELARFDYSYDLAFNLVTRLAKQRYPEQDGIIEFLCFNAEGQEAFSSLMDEVKQSKMYQDALAQSFDRKNVAAFAHFGISPKTIAVLDQLISIEGLDSESRREGEGVEVFKEYLGISQMSWMSYNYLSKEQGDSRRGMAD